MTSCKVSPWNGQCVIRDDGRQVIQSPDKPPTAWFGVQNVCYGAFPAILVDAIPGASHYGVREWTASMVAMGLRAAMSDAPVLHVGLFATDVEARLCAQAIDIVCGLASCRGIKVSDPSVVQRAWVSICYVDCFEQSLHDKSVWLVKHEDRSCVDGWAERAAKDWPSKIVVLSDAQDLRANKAACAETLMSIPAVVAAMCALRDVRLSGWNGAVRGCWWSARASIHEDAWAKQVGLPSFAYDPQIFATWGVKSGNHKLWRDAGVSAPKGTFELAHTFDALVHDLVTMIDEHKKFRWVVKADDSASGMGNAMLDLRGLEEDWKSFSDTQAKCAAVTNCLCSKKPGVFVAGDADEIPTIEAYVKKLVTKGGVVLEEFIDAIPGGAYIRCQRAVCGVSQK